MPTQPFATVTSSPSAQEPIGEPPAEQVPAVFGFSMGHSKTPYTEYVIESWYEDDPGTLALHLATDDTDTEANTLTVVNVAAPSMTRVVSFQMTRAGAYPVVPDPAPQYEGETLLSAPICFYAPRVLANGQRAWRVTGRYTYALPRALVASDGFITGVTAADGQFDLPAVPLPAVGPGNFSTGLIQEERVLSTIDNPGFLPPEAPTLTTVDNPFTQHQP